MELPRNDADTLDGYEAVDLQGGGTSPVSHQRSISANSTSGEVVEASFAPEGGVPIFAKVYASGYMSLSGIYPQMFTIIEIEWQDGTTSRLSVEFNSDSGSAARTKQAGYWIGDTINNDRRVSRIRFIKDNSANDGTVDSNRWWVLLA